MMWKNCKLVFGDSYIASTGCYDGGDPDVLVKTGMFYIHDLQKKPAIYPTQLQYIGITNATLADNTQKVKLSGYITTNIGNIQTDLMLYHLGKPIQDATGKVILHKVAIEAILPYLPIKSLSEKVAITAQGDHFNTLDAVPNLTEIETSHYNYKQIETSCMVSNAVVKFNLNSKDPTAKLAVTGSYHMDKHFEENGIIEQIHLKKFSFIATPLSLGTNFSLKIRNILSKRPRGRVILNQRIVQRL